VGTRVGVAGKALHVSQWHALFQQIGDGRHSARVRGKAHRQARVLQPALHYAADVDHVHGVLGELAGLLVGRPEEGSVLAGIAEAAASR
jgi:hypothetical protein